MLGLHTPQTSVPRIVDEASLDRIEAALENLVKNCTKDPTTHYRCWRAESMGFKNLGVKTSASARRVSGGCREGRKCFPHGSLFDADAF